MQHCLAYHGAFERNFPNLAAGATSFEGTDGTSHPVPACSAEVDGIRVYYMEKAGKKFAAVRIQNDDRDVVLENELLLDPTRHMGLGQRFSPEPIIITDEVMATILADVMSANPDQQSELAGIRSSFSVSASGKH